MKDTFVRVIKDPGNVLESVGQGMFDAEDAARAGKEAREAAQNAETVAEGAGREGR